MRIAIASVVKGLTLKTAVVAHLQEREGVEVTDLGVHAAEPFAKYNEVARTAIAPLQQGQFDAAILICGTGMGMAITANKYRGIRAACCESPLAAEMSRRVNNSNILTMGESLVAPDLACQMVDAWLDTKFQDAPSVPDSVRDFWREAVEDLDRIGSECGA